VFLTPIAFLQFVTGGSVGSGWNIPIANGLRFNFPTYDDEPNLVGDSFNGLVWSAKAGGLLQFDLAAVMPGAWHHVVFQTYHVAQYRALTSADPDESWLYEADSGENRNGWNYYGNYFLGYQMPIVLNMAGILFEEDLYLYDTPSRKLWGDDIPRWTLGAMLNFTVTKNLQITLLGQWRTMRNFTSQTEANGFYQYRRIVDSNDKLHVEFYRVALNATLMLK
jgi:hypothetical protein